MVKKLSDLTYECLMRNFARFTDVPLDIPPQHKQALLHRIIDHDLLTKKLLPVITYNLISPSLTCLCISNSLQFTDDILFHIGLIRCQLYSVELQSCGKVTDVGLTELLICQTRLASVQLKGLTINGQCLRQLQCPDTLVRLSLKGCAGLDAVHAVQCVNRHRKIECLNLRKVRAIKDEHMISIAQALGNRLKSLVISHCTNVSDHGLLSLADYCPNLEVLKLMECMNCSDAAIEHMLFACNQIKKLDLSYCSRYDQSPLTENVFGSLPRNLQILKLRGIQTNCSSDKLVGFMSELPNLTSLNMSGFNLMTSQKFFSDLLWNIGNQLRELEICSGAFPFDDTNLVVIEQNCPNLEVLGLNVCRNITGDPLVTLLNDPSRAEKLRVLRLAECIQLSERFLRAVSTQCTNLEFVDVSHALGGVGDIADDIIIDLVRNNGQTLEHLALRANQAITDSGVLCIGWHCANLRVLSISGLPRVTNECILCLANHCHMLTDLYLSGCTLIDNPAIRYLQDQCIGRVNVYHVVPGYGDSSLVAKNLDTGMYCRLRGTGNSLDRPY